MTREEYQHYSDCRQASFTYRKGQYNIFPYMLIDSYRPTAKRFREFLNLPPHLDLKANDDTVDIVGFLAFEMVRSLTLAGLTVKKALEESYLLEITAAAATASSSAKRKAPITPLLDSTAKRRRGDEDDDGDDTPLPVSSLFLPPPEARTSLRPEHIQDAFSRMQGDWSHHRSAGMTNWRGGLVRTRVSLI
jgi:transcription initiation protein SPT3